MILLDWSSARFAKDLSAFFASLHQSLEQVLLRAFHETQNGSYNHAEMQSSLLKRSIALNATYQQVSFELRLGRLSGQCSIDS
jgi:hypothetical protein